MAVVESFLIILRSEKFIRSHGIFPWDSIFDLISRTSDFRFASGAPAVIGGALVPQDKTDL